MGKKLKEGEKAVLSHHFAGSIPRGSCRERLYEAVVAIIDSRAC